VLFDLTILLPLSFPTFRICLFLFQFQFQFQFQNEPVQMKYALNLSALVLLSSLHASTAWTVGPRSLSRHSSSLRSLATPPAASSSSGGSSSSGRSSEEIQSEVSSGKVMEGGKIIDFSSVKASSRAEEAMAQARQGIHAAAAAQQNGAATSSSSTAILGINQDVIDQVGHELATFATQAEIQDCAAYLRSQAPAGLFQPLDDDTAVANTANNDSGTSTPEQIARYETLLARSYDESGEVTSAFAKTFYMGTMLMSPKAQKAIWAIYVWCRRTDEIVDAPRENDDDMLTDLSSWEMRLENLWNYGQVHDVYDLCLLDCRVKYPTLDITPFMDMIRGMLMDVPNLGQDRYELFDELHLYCYRVAGTVGLMSLPVFGCAEGYTDEIARCVIFHP
jgi:phytoene synthase